MILVEAAEPWNEHWEHVGAIVSVRMYTSENLVNVGSSRHKLPQHLQCRVGDTDPSGQNWSNMSCRADMLRHVGDISSKGTQMNIKILEDNVGALTLGTWTKTNDPMIKTLCSKITLVSWAHQPVKYSTCQNPLKRPARRSLYERPK